MNRRRILVVGYYSRENLGDDAFEHVLTNYFQERWSDSEYKFVSVDDLKEVPGDTSAVIFGGGDLVNDYFYHKIDRFINNKTCPWYAISIGIPYPDLVEKGYLNRFDYIIYRSQVDKNLLSNKFKDRSEWFPDMSFMLPFYHSDKINLVEYDDSNNFPKKIGICLSRNIYNKKDPDAYNRIINNIAKFLSKISRLHRQTWSPICGHHTVPVYELYFIPFCTDEKDSHDDRLINKQIYEKIMDYGDMNNVHLIDENIHMDKIIPIFNSFHLTICTRFHAHIFSLMTKTPILSIYTTRKVGNLIEEIGAQEYSCKMEIHPTKYYPIDIATDKLMSTFVHIEQTYKQYLTKLDKIHKLYIKETDRFIDRLDNLLFYNPRYLFPDEISKKGEEVAIKIAKKIKINFSPYQRYIDDILSLVENKLVTVINNNNNDNNILSIRKLTNSTGAIKKYFSNVNEDIKSKIIEIISYEITQNRFSDYHYGLSQQVFTDNYNLLESCKWIVNHHYGKDNKENYIFIDNKLYQTYDRKLNFSYINSNLFKGYHRSGWNYVVEKVRELHNPKGII